MNSKTCPACRTSYPAELDVCPRDGNALESQGWLPKAVVGGKYAILRRVSEDDVSVCYGVRVLESGEFRTLRALRPELAGDVSAVREFRRVGGVLQKIAHPNVVRVEAVEQAEDGRPFLVTDFIVAPSLAELLHDGTPLERKRVCAVAHGIAAALEACHRLGLLHLSLQPRNILVDGPSEDLHVKVQGFETAYVRATRNRDLPSAREVPLRDLVPPAPAYSSPEQVLARSPEFLDARSDLYSLGVLMYQMLAGRLPFSSAKDSEGSELASLAARLEEAPPVPAAAGEAHGLSEPLMELAMQLLERRPELRPATARAVTERIALAEVRVAAPVTAAFEFPPPVEPVALHVAEEPSAPVEFPAPAEVLPPAEEETMPAPPAGAPSLTGLDSAVPALESASIAPSGPGPVDSIELSEALPVSPEEGLTAEAPGWTSSDSILFTAEQPARDVKSTRWAWAVAAALVVAVGVGALVHLEGLKSHGAGPLSPLRSEQLRRMLGQGTVKSGAPAPPSQTATAQQPSANSAENAAPPSPGAQSPTLPVEQTGGNQSTTTAGTVGQQPSAENRVTPAPAEGVAATDVGASEAEKLSPAPKAEAGPMQEEGMAEVNRAVAAGDVFFELGQYDLAVRAYEGPLKLDPNNKLLHSRIERAVKAKAAEQQFLGQ